MKKINYTLLLLLLVKFVPAQEVDLDQVVIPVQEKPAEFRDYLVQLAWRNTPAVDALGTEIDIAEQEIKNERLGWTRAIGVSVGFNQQSSRVNVEGGGMDFLFFPRISFGASVNFTPLITTPGRVKVAKGKYDISERNFEQEKLRIRAVVHQLYEAYLLALEVQKVRTEMEEDARSNYTLLLELFKNDEASFEDYNRAFIEYHKARESRLAGNTDVKTAVIAMEEYIGIAFDEAERLFFGQ